MTDPMILPSHRDHQQQSVDEDVEQLWGRDTSCATPVSNMIVVLSVLFGTRRTVALS